MRFLLPVAVLLGLVILLGVGLRLDPRTVPSPLIGKPVPAFQLPRLEGDAGFSDGDLRGVPSIVNFFASWCTPCLEEHPVLMQLAREGGVRLVGINYKDAPDDALRWLARHGNPYAVVARDSEGDAGLDWGVYGVPETYLVDADGVILHKHVGPLTPTVWSEDFAPRLTGAQP